MTFHVVLVVRDYKNIDSFELQLLLIKKDALSGIYNFDIHGTFHKYK